MRKFITKIHPNGLSEIKRFIQLNMKWDKDYRGIEVCIPSNLEWDTWEEEKLDRSLSGIIIRGYATGETIPDMDFGVSWIEDIKVCDILKDNLMKITDQTVELYLLDSWDDISEFENEVIQDKKDDKKEPSYDFSSFPIHFKYSDLKKNVDILSSLLNLTIEEFNYDFEDNIEILEQMNKIVIE